MKYRQRTTFGASPERSTLSSGEVRLRMSGDGDEDAARSLDRPPGMPGNAWLCFEPMAMSARSEQILVDCRGAVGEVRFGFGSKRQVWAFEERQKLDCGALLEEMAKEDPEEFLRLAVAFHDEFAAINNSWSVRDHLQRLTADLCRRGGNQFLDGVVQNLVDSSLAVRHWLMSAFLLAPPLVVFRGLESALTRAYQPSELWALVNQLGVIARNRGWSFSMDTVRILSTLAQFSERPEDRCRALDLVAHFGGPAAFALLARATMGDEDASVRQRASELLAD